MLLVSVLRVCVCVNCFLSMSLKSLAALIVLIALIPYFCDLLVAEIADHSGAVDRYLEQILGS